MVAVEEGHEAVVPFGSRDAARLLARVDPPLTPPTLAHDPVNRRGLRDRLGESEARLALVVAPAGYGKTTLLAQWAADDPRPVGWVALTECDNDPPSMLAHLLLALEASVEVDDHHFASVALSPADLTSVLLPRFGVLVGDAPPMLWMLDDLHLLRSEHSKLVLDVLLDHLSPGSAIVLAGRRAPELPLARWRASRWVLEVGIDELTMSETEAAALVHAAGAVMAPELVEQVVERTEGWPAGIYLSALAQGFDVDAVGSGELAIADYLLDEVLRSFDDADTQFLIRSAVLFELSPSTCDAVLERADSAVRLERMARTNSFVRRVGPESYRYHQLFGDLLLAELRKREPGVDRALHRRASEVMEGVGDVDAAIVHAHAAGDRERAASLIWRFTAPYVGSGRSASLARWLAAFEPAAIAASPNLAMAAAWVAFTEGDPGETARWSTVLRSHDAGARLADGVVLGPLLALVDALVSRQGLGATLRDAERAYDELPAVSPYRVLACAVASVAARLTGDTTRARALASEGIELGMLFPATHAHCLAHAARLDADDGRWSRARSLADEALAIVATYGFEERPAMCLVYATAGAVHTHDGATDARDLLEHGAWLVATLNGVARFVALDARILLARSFALMGDLDEARRLLDEARGEIEDMVDPGGLPALVDQVRDRIVAAELPLGVSASPLTPAELRVLRYLPTHHSFAEIATELFVSRNTVKTQAIAVYRKLGVTSRGDAVERARAAGLLDQ